MRNSSIDGHRADVRVPADGTLRPPERDVPLDGLRVARGRLLRDGRARQAAALLPTARLRHVLQLGAGPLHVEHGTSRTVLPRRRLLQPRHQREIVVDSTSSFSSSSLVSK